MKRLKSGNLAITGNTMGERRRRRRSRDRKKIPTAWPNDVGKDSMWSDWKHQEPPPKHKIMIANADLHDRSRMNEWKSVNAPSNSHALSIHFSASGQSASNGCRVVVRCTYSLESERNASRCFAVRKAFPSPLLNSVDATTFIYNYTIKLYGMCVFCLKFAGILKASTKINSLQWLGQFL